MVSRRVLARHLATEIKNGASMERVATSLAAYVVTYRLQKQLSLLLGDIAMNLSKLGHTVAYVSTAYPLDPSLKKLVELKVKALEGDGSVEIIETVEPELIGGIVIETPTIRYDASIATKLKRLKQAI